MTARAAALLVALCLLPATSFAATVSTRHDSSGGSPGPSIRSQSPATPKTLPSFRRTLKGCLALPARFHS